MQCQFRYTRIVSCFILRTEPFRVDTVSTAQ